MPFGDLEIVLRRHRLRVADPVHDDVHWELLCEFRFSRYAQVLKQLKSLIQTCEVDDSTEFRAKTCLRVSVAADHMNVEHLKSLDSLGMLSNREVDKAATMIIHAYGGIERFQEECRRIIAHEECTKSGPTCLNWSVSNTLRTTLFNNDRPD